MTIPSPLTALLEHTVLDRKTERSLLVKAKSGDRAALNEICRCNQRHVYQIARRYHNFGYGGDQQLFDLIQWGNLGLLHAIRKWDHREGAFSTYSHYWIRAYVRRYAIIRGIRFSISYNQAERLGNIRASKARLTHALRCDPTESQIASDTGETLEDVRFSTSVARSVLSLDAETTSDDHAPNLYNVLPDSTEVHETGDLYKAIENLPEREQFILTHRYCLGEAKFLEYGEIAMLFGLSRTRIQQIEAFAKLKLKGMLLSP